jgi:outer membrane protein insertion porin family
METKERWFFSFITGSGIYKKDEMKADIERIRELYHSRGYIYVVVAEPEITLSQDKTELYIKISISENDQFKIGEVSLNGNTVFKSTELYEYIETTPGKIFNRSALRNDIDNILDLYMERGYARADIDPLIEINAKEKLVDVVFSITEGEIYRIGRIEISGNKKTRDKVIRREIRLDEGDIYNHKLLKRSRQRLVNLNYFKSVELATMPSIGEKLIDVDVKVEEKLTGMLTIGGGYSSIDKFIVTGEIMQANLFGKGLYLKLRADLSASRKNYNISLRDPWFMDRPISASVSIYNETFEYLDYDKDALGASVGFGKELSEYVGANIIYNFENVKIFGITEDASTLIKEQEGKKITSSISPAIWKDTRDNYLDPTSGSRNALYTTYAGIGGDNYFGKVLVDSIWYFPAIWNITFSVRGRVGYASGFPGKKLPLYERFYVGGINTVRGLGFGEGGPRDEEGEKIGGKTEIIFNTELIFPIEENINLKGVLFFDAGRSFDKTEYVSVGKLRPTTGFGLRWLSPFGPIRLEWGFNLSQKSDESASKIEFSMGGIF